MCALTFFYDCEIAIAGPARCAAAIMEAPSLQAADEILLGMGIRTELGWESARAAEAAAAEQA